MQTYLDTETDETVQAEQYFGFSGQVNYNSAIIYLNNTDWLIILPNGSITGYTDTDFSARFTLVV